MKDVLDTLISSGHRVEQARITAVGLSITDGWIVCTIAHAPDGSRFNIAICCQSIVRRMKHPFLVNIPCWIVRHPSEWRLVPACWSAVLDAISRELDRMESGT